MADLVVYTAISGDYDTLKPPPPRWIDSARFVAFVDRPQPANGWELRRCYHRWKDNCRNAKDYKILFHEYFPDSPLTLWIDGSVSIKPESSPDEFLGSYNDNPALAVFPHRTRRCIYTEASVCIAKKKDDAEVINRQIARYRALSYPEMNGLAECCVLLRRNNAVTKQLCELWYDEILKGSRRDQLSFDYVAWHLGCRYQNLPGNIDRNNFFSRGPHLQSERTPDEAILDCPAVSSVGR